MTGRDEAHASFRAPCNWLKLFELRPENLKLSYTWAIIVHKPLLDTTRGTSVILVVYVNHYQLPMRVQRCTALTSDNEEDRERK